MPFNIFTIRTAEDSDGRLYPVLGAAGANYPMETEELDGTIERLTVSGFAVFDVTSGEKKSVILLKGVPAEIFITDARLVIACEKWNQGGRSWGIGLGATTAFIDNTVKKIKEARERRGQLLLGQIRYLWLSHVGYNPTRNAARNPELELGVSHRVQADNSIRRLSLVLTPKHVELASLAQSIVQRASKHWLAYGTFQNDAHRQKIVESSTAPVLPAPGPYKYATYTLPFYQLASTAGVPQKPEEATQRLSEAT